MRDSVLLGHRRETNAARPAMPGGNGQLPLPDVTLSSSQSRAADVHDLSPDVQAGKLKPFPRLRSFNMRFDHGRHGAGAAPVAPVVIDPHAGDGASFRQVSMLIQLLSLSHAECKIRDQNISSCGALPSPGRPSRTLRRPRLSLGFSLQSTIDRRD